MLTKEQILAATKKEIQTAYREQIADNPSPGCTRCPDCTRCYGCTNCYDCTGCSGCTGCYGCYGCTGCTGCTGCYGCYGCYGLRYAILGIEFTKDEYEAFLLRMQTA